jgi:hypothetical protein
MKVVPACYTDAIYRKLTMSRLRNNYYVQNGCWNCAHVFGCDEYDFWILYCACGAPKRPPGPCGGDHMTHATEAEEDAAWDAARTTDPAWQAEPLREYLLGGAP